MLLLRNKISRKHMSMRYSLVLKYQGKSTKDSFEEKDDIKKQVSNCEAYVVKASLVSVAYLYLW